MTLHAKRAEGPSYGFFHPVMGYELQADVRGHDSEELVTGCWRGRAYREDQQKPAEVLECDSRDHSPSLWMRYSIQRKSDGVPSSHATSNNTTSSFGPPMSAANARKKKVTSQAPDTLNALNSLSSRVFIRERYDQSGVLSRALTYRTVGRETGKNHAA